MTTELDIANRALNRIRNNVLTITSFTAGTPESNLVNLNYASTRDNLLRMFPWGFAKRTVLPTLLKSATGAPWTTTQPPMPWERQYTIPADSLRIRKVSQSDRSDQPFLYEISQDGLNTDAYPAVLTYTQRVTDPNKWSVDFTQAMVTMLAAEMVVALGGDLKLKQILQAEADRVLAVARLTMANEDIEVHDITPDWLAARQC